MYIFFGGLGGRSIKFLHHWLYTSTADGDDVQATTPVDSALIPQAAGSEVVDQEPEDKAGMYL